MKITLNSLNNSEITLDVNHIGSISALNPYTESFKLTTKDGESYDIVYSQYNDVLAVIGSAGGGGGSTEYQGLPVVQTTERDLTLEANKYYIFGKCETLTIDIGEPITDGKLNEYRFEFISGATPTVLTLPNYLTPVSIQPNTKYAISIKNNVLAEIGSQYSDIETFSRNLFNRTITSIIIPEGVTALPMYMFYQCRSLTSVTLPSTLRDIGNYAFYQCNALSEINFPPNLVTIGQYAFNGCTSLNSVVLPEGVTTINPRAFEGCSSLTNIGFPSTLAFIGNYAFNGCPIQNPILPNSLRTIDTAAFNACRNISNITLPNQLVTLSNSILSNCSSLTNVVIPNSVTSIGSGCFQTCSGLTHIEIPESVTTIGQQSFQNCIALRDIVLHDSITAITGTNVFAGINAGCKVRIYGTTRVIPFLLGCPNTIEFYVDSTMVQAYKTNSAWSARASYIHSLEEYTP